MFESKVYKLVEILLIVDSEKEFITTRIEFANAKAVLNGNYLIISQTNYDNPELTTTSASVFHLDKVKTFRTTL